MIESTARNRIGNGRVERWRAWARALTGAGVMRRRAPLAMALVRRSRTARWIAQRNVVSQHCTGNLSILVQPRLQLAVYRPQSWNNQVRNSVLVTTPGVTRSRTVTVRHSESAAPIALQHRWTLAEERTQSKTLLREIVERTCRIEERVRVERRLVARTAPAPATGSDAQDIARRSGPDWWKDAAPQISKPAATPAVNVNEIAETVMRRLDQRVSAWRERMGRM
jgi:hypothetical protein